MESTCYYNEHLIKAESISSLISWLQTTENVAWVCQNLRFSLHGYRNQRIPDNDIIAISIEILK